MKKVYKTKVYMIEFNIREYYYSSSDLKLQYRWSDKSSYNVIADNPYQAIERFANNLFGVLENKKSSIDVDISVRLNQDHTESLNENGIFKNDSFVGIMIGTGISGDLNELLEHIKKEPF